MDRRTSDASDLLDDPSWFLDRLDFERGLAVFTQASRDMLSGAAFLDGRWDHRGAAQRALPLSRLRAFRVGQRPPAILWHTAFCCSTLIATCLDAPGIALALKEPIALVDLNTARRRGMAEDPALTAAVVSRVGQGFSSTERAVIKPSNGANALILETAPTGAPMILLYSSCREFLLSVVAGGEARRQYARDLMYWRVRSTNPPLGLSIEHLAGLSDLQIAALVWHVQVAEFRAAARTLGPGQARALDCQTFLAAPERTLNALDQFLELGLGGARLRQVAEGPLLRRHAKQPNLAFAAADRDQSFKAAEATLGPTLDGLVDWSYKNSPDTPRGDPIGSPLLALNS